MALTLGTTSRKNSLGALMYQLVDFTVASGDTSATVTAPSLSKIIHIVDGSNVLAYSAAPTFSNNQATLAFSVPTSTASTASIATTTPIILTNATASNARNTNTFKVVVNAAAANPTDTVLVAFTGTSAAVICTVTPNDGTHNTAAPVDVTTAQLKAIINTGLAAGLDVTLTDASSLRVLQTATGGDTTALAHGGEGDNVTATFSGGITGGGAGTLLLIGY